MNRWSAGLVRGTAIVMLLGTAACQQNGGSPQGGMFGGSAATPANGAAQAAAAPATQNQAAPAAATPAAAIAPVPAPAAAPAAAPVAAALAAVAADGQDRRVRVTNQSGQRITLIKGSPSNDSNWGEDRIPSGTLPAGNAVIIDFNDNNGQCVYDLQATMADGTTREQRAVNICRVADWIVTAQGTSAR